MLASFCFVSPSAFAETNTITLTKVVKGVGTVSKIVKISANMFKLFCQNAVNPNECESNADAAQVGIYTGAIGAAVYWLFSD
ncbi:hypothetical protein PN36_06640 [Candidatus Thiomargarita nelsonii]|uniref:Uncharacterized protein n=1 Tax=Candidatus Thiomargarita nelsonii TaxID=1003181 RepID=A0A4E0R4H4_9GAMM|nr:hypothetical protein PN36_06640 [Candidatus Thiomargarita nelsonii]